MEKKQPFILCVGQHGRCVIFGYCDGTPEPGERPLVERPRMVLRWPAACGGLFGLAANGPKEGLQLTAEVHAHKVPPVDAAIPVTAEVAAALQEWPEA